MDYLAFLSKNIIAPLAAYKDNEKHFSVLKKLRKTQYLSEEKLKEYQKDKLNKLLTHAYTHVPFYNKRFQHAGINPHKDDVDDYFREIPFLTKEDIQTNLSELTAVTYKKENLIANKTGGSTGKPLQYFHNKERMDSMKAAELRHNQWAGWDTGDKIGIIWGARHDFSPMDSLKAKLRNVLIDRNLCLDTSAITDQKMFDFAKNLIRFKPKGILAYANSMYEFARFIKENKITGINPFSIITSAEVLHDHERKLIEEVFHCKIFNRYGCREVSVIASECEKHEGMHIAVDSLKVEFIKNEGIPATGGEEGNIIITDLFNLGMPFIRYKIEDVGIPSMKKCSCGRTLPLMETVTGRVTEFLITPEGVKISGASVTIYIIANTPGIKQAQFVQNKKDEITLNLVRGNNFTENSVTFLDSKMPEFFGKNITVQYNFVDYIAKEASGKYRFSICNI